MREKVRNGVKKYWRKGLASFFASIMIFQAVSGVVDIAAYEMGKVNLADTKGSYYNQKINGGTSLNQEEDTNQKDVLKKEATVYNEEEEYDPKTEVIEKRTSNSKTYQLRDGSYVTDTYFEPIHKKEGETFVEIDNTLENTSKARSNPIYENKDGLYAFKVQNKTASITNDKQQSLSITNDNANLNTYDVKENVILYSEVYENIDMEYRLSGNAVGTNFFMNGATTTKDISLSIEKGDLIVKEVNDALLFVDQEETVIFSYVKPTIVDAKGDVQGVSFAFKEENENVNITLTLDAQWINNAERSYPLKLSTRAADESTEINVTTSYNREANPNQNSNYYQLFVGYEDGSLSGGTYFGVSRTYVHVSGMNLGADKLILGAKLKLWKLITEPQQWNEIAIGKTSGYVNPLDATWNNKPAVTHISTTNVRADAGWQEFDVRSYIEDIYKGVNNTIELKATNESSAHTPNIFSSESGTGMPKISVTYRDAFDVNPNLPIDTFDTEMRIFSFLNKGFEALSFDGIARPDAQVVFDLVERGNDDVIKTVTSKGNSSKYFIDPIYITNHIANTQTYPKGNVNYTTDYVYKNTIPEFDVPYEYKVNVKAGSVSSTKEFRSDSFIKYKVKTGDNLKNLAAYYGLTIEEIKTDNNLTTNTIKEDDVLIIRFKKNNDKVSEDVYTPPQRTVEYKAKYVNRGPRCSGGVCEIIDPVNANTGNYYAEENDFTIKDAEAFSFTRYYNSTGPQLSNLFGNGFTTPIESYLSYDKKGNMLYFTGDGKLYEFEKTANGYASRSQDKMEISLQGENVTIKDLNTNTIYEFDVYGTLDTITSYEGVVTNVNYDTYGLITSVLVGDKKIEFNYNDKKLVKSVTLPSGTQMQYEYDANRNLTQVKDVLGNTKKYEYDENHYLVSITDKNNVEATKNTYDNEGRVLKQIDGKGNVSTIEYKDKTSILTNAGGSNEEYTFNDEYDTISIKQGGNETSSYTYDSYRNITTATDADGKVTTYTYNKQNLLKAEYSDGTSEEYRYDANNHLVYQKDKEGNVTNTTYDVNNDVISIVENNKVGTIYEYDSKRRVVKETDPYGAVKSYTYVGNMIASITYSNGLVETFEYDANGNTLNESDNQGKITTYVYNVNNEMTQKNYYDGSNEKWRYDANGNITSCQDRIGGITTNSYDKNNNLIASKKGSVTTSKVYNEINQLISERDEQGTTRSYKYDIFSNKVEEIDTYGNRTKYEYDANQNIIKTTDVYGNEEINEYNDNNLVKTIGNDGLVTTFEYDSFNREVKKTNPNGTSETKEYIGLLLTKETDSKGTVIEHVYDAFDREYKTITTYSDGVVSTTQNTFDVYGNIIETKVDGRVSKTTYDVYKQAISTSDALGNTTRQEYDLDGNVVKEIDALGNVSMTEYDANKNVLSTTDKNGNTERKTYDVNGLLVSEKDALGFIKTYTYNAKGQVVEVKDAYNNISTFSYDAFGNPIETKLEGNVIEKKEYDRFGREIYVETLDAKTSMKLDDFNRKVEETNELTGLTTYYSYDEYGNLITQKDSEGLSSTFEYDVFNRNIKSIDAYGRVEETIYNVRDQVLETDAFDGLTTTSVYDDYGNVIEGTDGLGKVTKNTYNALNQLVKEEVGSKVSEYVYDANGQQVEVKSINNNTSTKTIYDKNGNTIESINALGYATKTEYDAKNQVIASIDANGNRSTKEYDAYGNVVKETNALGFSKQTKFNKYGLKELEVDERGFDTTYQYNDELLLENVIDSSGNKLEVFYNKNKQKIKEVDSNGGVTQFSYDAYGREIKTIAPNGKKTSKEYDALGNVIKETSGRKTTISKYDKLGRVKETSMNGVVQTTNKYNKRNQIIESKDANKNTSTFKYDEHGSVVYANEKGFASEKEYDEYGNLIQQIDNKTYVTKHVYDANHKLLTTTINDKTSIEKQYDPVGNEMLSIEAGVEVHNTYDEANRLCKVEVPSSIKQDEFVAIQTITYDESGNPLTITDANGNVEEKKYDANNNVIEETNKNGIVSKYEFDGLNNMTKVQNHNERYVSYTYDKSNNVMIKNINNKFAEYTYDEDNNLISESDEYKYTSKYEYDSFGRKTTMINPDGTTINYTYDALGNVLNENKNTFTYDERNNVVSATNQEGTLINTYDAFNNKTAVKDTKGNTVLYVFNEDNKLSQMKYDNTVVDYTYTQYGNVEKIHKNQALVASYQYNARNEVTTLTQEKAITTKTYDDMGRVVSQTSTKANDVVFDASYVYDANDNLIKEIVDGNENTYTYNTYDELEESNKYIDGKRVKTTYTQDVFGNQLTSSSSEGKQTYHYNERNQIKTIDTDKGIIAYTYDKNGNVSEKKNENGSVDEYTYNDFNELTQLKQGQFTYDYTYDAENERIQQVRTDTKDYHYDVWYQYSLDLEVVSDEKIEDSFTNLKQQVSKKKSNGNVCEGIVSEKYDVTYFKQPEVTEYTIDRNREFSEVIQENNTIHVYGDTLLQSNNTDIVSGFNDSVVAKIDSDKTSKIVYNDYGSTSNINAGHGYNGDMLDRTGLIYLRARYYDPSVSRFIQIDNNYDGEQKSVSSQNRYVYTLNNPYKYVDRNGKWGFLKSIVNTVVKVAKKVVNAVVKVAKEVVTTVVGFFSPSAAKAINNVIDGAGKVVNNTIGVIGNVLTTKGGGFAVVKAVFKKVAAVAKCPEKEKSFLENAWENVVGFGKDVWNGITDFGSAVWAGICDVGSFVVKKGKDFLTWVDSILDTVAKVGAVVVFAAGVVATAATLAAAIPALAGATILGASIGAIGYGVGAFALYGGMFVMGASATQIGSGATGYRLDGSKMSESDSKNRINSGMTNLSIATSGAMMGGAALVNNNYTGKGASGAKIGDVFGKNGKLVENPQTKIDWSKTTTHGVDRMTERGVTSEMAESWVRNGKVLEQANGAKHLFFTPEGAVVVATDGTVVTTIPSSYYDEGYLELSKKLFGK